MVFVRWSRQKNAVDQAEDGSGRADPECQGDDGNGHEPRSSGEQPQTEPDVLTRLTELVRSYGQSV